MEPEAGSSVAAAISEAYIISLEVEICNLNVSNCYVSSKYLGFEATLKGFEDRSLKTLRS